MPDVQSWGPPSPSNFGYVRWSINRRAAAHRSTLNNDVQNFKVVYRASTCAACGGGPASAPRCPSNCMYIVLVLERRLEKSYMNPKKQLLSLHVVLVSPGVSRLGCSLSTVLTQYMRCWWRRSGAMQGINPVKTNGHMYMKRNTLF